MILVPGGGSLFEINKLTLGAFVKVVIVGLALGGHGEAKKKTKPDSEIQSCTS